MVSIVMPAYNEEEIIEASVRDWYTEVVEKIDEAVLVVVNDKSSDSTGEILDRLEKELPRLRPIHSRENQGHGPTVRMGLDAASSEYVFQTDSDRQHLPSEFWNLWEHREHYDFVVGVRSTREDGAFRKAITALMRDANLVIWGVWIQDANCPFKLMRRDAMNEVLALIPQNSFIPMVHFSVLARKLGFRVKEVPVTHLPRTGGTQSLKGLVKWARVTVRCVLEIIRLRLFTRLRRA